MLSRQFASCIQLCRSFASTVPTIGTAQNNVRKAAERATALKQKASAVLVAAKEKAAEKKMRERERKALQDAKLKEQMYARNLCFEIKQMFSLCCSLSRARFSRFSRASPSALICSRDTNFRRSAARKAAEDAKPKKPTRVLSLTTAVVRVGPCARA